MKFPKDVRAAKRPSRRNHAGRTWDTCTVVLPDGREIEGHLDTTWSLYFYFELDGAWKRGDIGLHERGGALTMDLRGSFDDMGGGWKLLETGHAPQA